MRSFDICAALALSFLAAAEPIPKRSEPPTPTVRLGSQNVVGVATQVPGSCSSQAVNKFLGLRFANQPERFAPASKVDISATSGVIQATASPAACPQQFFGNTQGAKFIADVFENPVPTLISEDCLFLNVFVPTGPPPNGGWPVMFWIYGGDLELGDISQPTYDGSVFAAEQDVIVVTANYRVSAFGFPNWEQLPNDERNLGFLDQRVALSFVQENIAAFGGNPKAVTIFGESAGGYSVKQLVALPPNPLNFRAAIIESEAVNSGTTTNLTTLAHGLGCSSSEDPLTCVRAANFTDIINIIEAHSYVFYPTVDNITATNDNGVNKIIESGNFARVPTIIGTNGDEGGLFVVLADLDASSSSKKRGLQKKRMFKRQLAGIPTPNATDSEIVTLEEFQCPVSNLTQLLVSQGLSVHRYFYNASFPNNVPFPDAGAFHTSEIPEVFGTYNKTQATSEQVLISKFMNTAWANFAKNPSIDPASNWPKLGATSQNNILNIQDSGIAALLSSDRLDAACKDVD